MVYTTTDTQTSVEWIYTTSTTASPRNNIVYKPIDTIVYDSMRDYIKPRDKYICNYCGTRYVTDKNGFIPNCKNCGAKMDKDKDEI